MRTKHSSKYERRLRSDLLTVNQQVDVLSSALVTRAKLAASLGRHFDGDRNVYGACGYPTTLQYSDYEVRYQRQDIAKRIVNAGPDACWRADPDVLENEDKDTTAFEEAWNALWDSRTLRIKHYLKRADRVAGIGRYGVLLLGFDDNAAGFDRPVESASELLYLKPYSEDNAKVKTWNRDKNDERFGLPEIYAIKVNVGGDASSDSTSVDVHHSRVVHIAEETLESDVYGTPRLEAIFNRLMDVEKMVGGSAEGMWRGGFPAYSFETEAGAKLQNKAAMEDEIENFIHKLTRVLRLQGVKTNVLQHQLANPKFHLEVQMWLIAAATGIPLRILIGSERGQLASQMDERTWNERVDERRTSFCGPVLVSGLIDRLIAVGVLPEAEYQVQWPDIDELSEEDKANVGKINTESLVKYADSADAQMLFPVYYYLTRMLNMDDEEATKITQESMKLIQDEERRAQEDAALLDEEDEVDEDEGEEDAVPATAAVTA